MPGENENKPPNPYCNQKVRTPMQYEIRETTASNDPADRGTLLSYAATFSEAQAKAAAYTAQGRNVFVSKSA